MEQGGKQPAGSARAAQPRNAAPRYLRFVRALVLGSALAAAPISMGACHESPCATSANCVPPDGPVADAAVPDAHADAQVSVPVDGPLPPPDLPLA